MFNLSKWMFIRKLLRKLRVELLLDIGANTGQFAQAMRQIGYAGVIMSFEPIPEVFAQAKRRMAGDSKWIGFNVGIGEKEETRTIHCMQASIFSSFNRPTSEMTRVFEDRNRVLETREVQVRRLDSVLAETSYDKHLGKTFLKSDTQGYEMQVFRGLGSMLPSIPAIQCEISSVPIYERAPHMIEILTFLTGRGFRPACFFPVSPLADETAIEFDCVFINSFAESDRDMEDPMMSSQKTQR
jgi:FkbM family methyltransferase